MIKHVAVFKLKDEFGASEADEFVRRLNLLPGLIPGIESFSAVRDAGLRPGNGEVAVLAEFESPEAFTGYVEHAAHQAVITDCIGPWVATRVALQFAA
jgi:heme-degrading monooxygenase HmoA